MPSTMIQTRNENAQEPDGENNEKTATTCVSIDKVFSLSLGLDVCMRQIQGGSGCFCTPAQCHPDAISHFVRGCGGQILTRGLPCKKYITTQGDKANE
mmetsp:Transcript_33778/g.77931  ORF Transcript_33778/g.77931 Transcript_33778/m.77931 type:complete len:98 (+) Transcript_33778:753-1046(+)